MGIAVRVGAGVGVDVAVVVLVGVGVGLAVTGGPPSNRHLMYPWSCAFDGAAT